MLNSNCNSGFWIICAIQKEYVDQKNAFYSLDSGRDKNAMVDMTDRFGSGADDLPLAVDIHLHQQLRLEFGKY